MATNCSTKCFKKPLSSYADDSSSFLRCVVCVSLAPSVLFLDGSWGLNIDEKGSKGMYTNIYIYIYMRIFNLVLAFSHLLFFRSKVV